MKARRRKLALWSLLPALLALAWAAKLLSVGWLGGYASEAFSSSDREALAVAARWLGVANVVEPYKASFAAGDAKVLAGDFAAARRDFEEALEAGAGDDECKVRVNLVLTLERLGDAASAASVQAGGSRSGAEQFFRDALEVAAGAPATCHQDGPGNSAGEGGRLDSAKDRIDGKLLASEMPPDAGGDNQESSAPQDEQLKQLQDSARKAQQERAEGQQREEYLRGPDQGPGVDKPW
ncbi:MULTISPECIES: hypothetical protein [unclassified Paenarthrobacter]|uniref:hypothetical protein n=1 Tax=unclassified Paenarthrobacter TaxID=2634190 RepID=UPI003CED6484